MNYILYGYYHQCKEKEEEYIGQRISLSIYRYNDIWTIWKSNKQRILTIINSQIVWLWW
mgnify:CR=1 FL=1